MTSPLLASARCMCNFLPKKNWIFLIKNFYVTRFPNSGYDSSVFRQAALVLCRDSEFAEIIKSHELEITTLANLSSLRVCHVCCSWSSSCIFMFEALLIKKRYIHTHTHTHIYTPISDMLYGFLVAKLLLHIEVLNPWTRWCFLICFVCLCIVCLILVKSL